ncbi:MAG: universal stress protein, partial [Actinomycetota bacterium]
SRMASAILESVLEGLQRDADADTTIVTAVAYGSPAAALIAYADDVDAQILVAGNRQMKGLGRVMGSVGAQIARDANCAVYLPRTVELVAEEEAAAADAPEPPGADAQSERS